MFSPFVTRRARDSPLPGPATRSKKRSGSPEALLQTEGEAGAADGAAAERCRRRAVILDSTVRIARGRVGSRGGLRDVSAS